MKKHILLIIFFLSNIFSIQAMMTTLRRNPFARWQGAGRQNVAKSFVLQKSTSNLVSRSDAPSSLSTGIQKRFYSNPAPQETKSGFWNWISSFFNQKPIYSNQLSVDMSSKQDLSEELRAKGFDKIITEVLYPKNIKQTIGARGNQLYSSRIFDENNFEKAKGKIGDILELSKDYKTFIRRKPISDGDRWSPDIVILKYFYNKVGAAQPDTFEGTILDEVLCKIFAGNYTFFPGNPAKEDVPDELLTNYRYIKLAQWLINQGAKINSDNEKNYVIGYEKCLISGYKELYELKYSPEEETFSSENVNLFKKIFASLDPIMEKLISNPELKKEFYRMQKVHQNIDSNPQEYRKTMEEEGKRKQYIKEKAEKLEREYRAQTGLYKDISEFISEVQFDELEYEEWKETGYMKGEKERIEQQRREWQQQWEQGGREKAEQEFREWRRKWEQQQGQEYESTSDSSDDYTGQKIEKLKKKFKLLSNASAEMILDAVMNYIKLEHPDKLKNKDMSEEEKQKKAKEYGEFIGYYDDTIKELKKLKKQEQQEKESKA